MQFLKTLFWVAFAVAAVLFAHANWFPVPIKLWSELEADVKLPVLVFGSFLLGFLPTLILYRTRLWSVRRRQETQAQVRVANAPGSATVPQPAAATEAESVRL